MLETKPRRTTRRKTTGKAKKASAQKATTPRLMTPEDLNRFLLVSSPRIAPDGSRIVFVRKHVGEKNEYETNLWIVDASAHAEPVQFTSGKKDRQPRWSPGGGTIAFVAEREKHKPQIHLIPARGGEAQKLSKFPEGSFGDLKWSPDGKHIAVSFREQDPQWTQDAKKTRKEKGLSEPARVIDDWWYRLDGDGYFNGQRYHLYLIDVETQEHRRLYSRDTMGFFSFDFSPDGKQIALTTNTDRKAMIHPWKMQIVVLDVEDGKTRKVPDLPPGDKTSIEWSPDGQRLAYAAVVGREGMYTVENVQVFICDPKKGDARSLTGKEDFCLMAAALTDTAEVAFAPVLRWHPDGRRIFMQIGARGETHIASVGIDGGRLTFHTKGAASHEMGNFSRDGKRLALTRGTATKLAEVHVGQVGARSTQVKALTDLNAPLLSELKLAGIESHTISSADGNEVQVWVMMPPDHEPAGPKKHPAILEIHGGPHAQYGVGFFHEFQVLAASGYAVFFSNPRGSKGYGRDFCAAIKGHWGTADWVDIEAVIEFMQSHRNVDWKRMGVMGGSYGGYMTNWVIGHTDVFAGAITDRCVSNMVTMGGTSDFVDEPDDYFPGNFWDRPEERWEQSPMRYIGNAKTPTLIIHSEGDLRCNIEQAEQLFMALKLLNVPTRLVRYPRSTSHGLSRGGPPDLRLHRLHQILSWWEKYLKKKRSTAGRKGRSKASR